MVTKETKEEKAKRELEEEIRDKIFWDKWNRY
jgi:hypothetical protein